MLKKFSLSLMVNCKLGNSFENASRFLSIKNYFSRISCLIMAVLYLIMRSISVLSWATRFSMASISSLWSKNRLDIYYSLITSSEPSWIKTSTFYGICIDIPLLFLFLDFACSHITNHLNIFGGPVAVGRRSPVAGRPAACICTLSPRGTSRGGCSRIPPQGGPQDCFSK